MLIWKTEILNNKLHYSSLKFYKGKIKFLQYPTEIEGGWKTLEAQVVAAIAEAVFNVAVLERGQLLVELLVRGRGGYEKE